MGNNDIPPGTFAAQSAPSLHGSFNQPPVQNQIANSSATGPIFLAYGRPPSAAGREQYVYGHPSIGPTFFTAESFAPQGHMQAYSLTDLASTGVQPQPFLTNVSLPPSAPPSEGISYPTEVHSQVSNPPGVAGSTSMSSSADMSSHPYSLFDNVSVSAYSHVHSSSNADPPPQSWTIPTSTSNTVLSSWLRKNPFVISVADLLKLAGTGRYNGEWLNWEKEFIIVYWVGPNAESQLVFLAMSTIKSPGPNDDLGKYWEAVRVPKHDRSQY